MSEPWELSIEEEQALVKECGHLNDHAYCKAYARKVVQKYQHVR